MRQRLREAPSHWLEILGATVFWCLLWGGRFSPSDVLGGLLVAAVVVILFPLPRLSVELTLRPWSFLTFVARFLADMFVSSLQVSWYALRPSGTPGNSVIAVQLRSRSDLFLTATGMLCTLVPGSVVVEAQRSTGTLFLHVIGAYDTATVEAARQRVLRQEERVLRALARRDVLEGAHLP
ncbi:Na+/H+ antiporter subunit E [Brachybacterium huguangmaarense]|uniref:Na+/H+ antiporter subunit E n=1 Tax=Brachybacterium huguangmaarense TaxID=1652028 RepID=A0ABY6G5T9_9MICO|nr:Na+/H+ antiporter subunit E [Brachybacterium huguangmaarense]UYG18058.1 Na+/H+ antiporter subunit E [Brachybacterium huguangmaarense]